LIHSNFAHKKKPHEVNWPIRLCSLNEDKKYLSDNNGQLWNVINE
jgi:hypothetical protein